MILCNSNVPLSLHFHIWNALNHYAFITERLCKNFIISKWQIKSFRVERESFGNPQAFRKKIEDFFYIIFSGCDKNYTEIEWNRLQCLMQLKKPSINFLRRLCFTLIETEILWNFWYPFKVEFKPVVYIFTF